MIVPQKMIERKVVFLLAVRHLRNLRIPQVLMMNPALRITSRLQMNPAMTILPTLTIVRRWPDYCGHSPQP